MYRSSDPETSKVAAESIVPQLRALQRAVYERYVAEGPMTAKQCERLDVFADRAPSTVRKRVSELWKKGVLRDTGRVIDGCTVFEVVDGDQ